MRLYEVGGHVRDGLLGLKSKDVDYAVEMEPKDGIDELSTPSESYQEMNTQLSEQGFKIFLESPEHFTTRAMFPENHEHEGVADFVMCRKEIGYVEGTRNPIIEVGTLYDDLERRDFTVNAIARCVETGQIIDPFYGQVHLKDMALKCPLNAETSFNDDPLRILRALRFKVTKGFYLHHDIVNAVSNFDAKKMSVVSTERIKDELSKMFKHDTVSSLTALVWLSNRNYELYEYLFQNNLWLEPTMKQK
jgi:poly(A) polymerase